MNSHTAQPDVLDATQIGRDVDEACDRFEAAWRRAIARGSRTSSTVPPTRTVRCSSVTCWMSSVTIAMVAASLPGRPSIGVGSPRTRA